MFPLVKKDGVTACLPLAKLNNEGIPAGCEGFLTAIAGMMLCKELTGIIPWIASINKTTNEACMFSHCTIAPCLVSDFSVKTHFETGMGTAIEGNFKSDLVTFSDLIIISAKHLLHPQTYQAGQNQPLPARTQIEVKLTEDEIKLLRQRPLGNHHLIFPGDCKELLHLTCLLLGIDILK